MSIVEMKQLVNYQRLTIALRSAVPCCGKYFGSRQAYGLTYTSCQESGKYDGLFRRLGAKMGMDAASVRRALKEL